MFSLLSGTHCWANNRVTGEQDSVPDHHPHDCLLNRLFRRISKKTSKLRVTERRCLRFTCLISDCTMMTSSNGNIFRVTGHLCGEFTTQRPVTRSFDVFFDLRLNKRLSKQSWGWWFETLSCPLWRHCNDSFKTSTVYFCTSIHNRILAYWLILSVLQTNEK